MTGRYDFLYAKRGFKDGLSNTWLKTQTEEIEEHAGVEAAPAAAQLQTAPTSGGTRTPKSKAKAKGTAACDIGKKRATGPGTAETEVDQPALKQRKTQG